MSIISSSAYINLALRPPYAWSVKTQMYNSSQYQTIYEDQSRIENRPLPTIGASPSPLTCSRILYTCVVNTSSRRRREGVQAHQYTQDTGTQRSTMRKLGKKWREKQEAEAPGFLFLILSFYCLIYNNYFNNILTNARQVLFRYTLVVQYLAPTAITRYWCYRYRILPVMLY